MHPISKESLIIGELTTTLSSSGTIFTVQFNRVLKNGTILATGIELDDESAILTVDADNDNMEYMYVPSSTRTYSSATGLTTVDLSTTGKRGLAFAGAEYTTEVSSNKKSHSSGAKVTIRTDHYSDAITHDILKGELATGAESFDIGSGSGNVTVKANGDGFIRLNATSSKVEFSNDGTIWTEIDDVTASNLLVVSGDDTTPGYLDDKLTVASGITKTVNNPSGNENLELGYDDTVLVDITTTQTVTGEKQFSDIRLNEDVQLTATSTEINQALSGIGSDVTAANLDTLTDGSAADALHTHALSKYIKFSIQQLTADVTAGSVKFTSTPDGSYIYSLSSSGSSPSVVKNIKRYARCSITGQYYYDGTSIGLSESEYDWGNQGGGICAGDNYVWVAERQSATNDVRIVRLTHALASPQTMTISGSASNTLIQNMCGDDDNLYLALDSATTSYLQYSISGTTATRGSDITITGVNGNVVFGMLFDGTDIIIHKADGTLGRYNTSGTLQDSKSVNFGQASADSSVIGAIAGLAYRDDNTLFTMLYRGILNGTIFATGQAISRV